MIFTLFITLGSGFFFLLLLLVFCTFLSVMSVLQTTVARFFIFVLCPLQICFLWEVPGSTVS